MCNWVLRTFQTRGAIPIITLFTFIIRPNVEYGCQVWSQTKKQEIVKLEKYTKAIYLKIKKHKAPDIS